MITRIKDKVLKYVRYYWWAYSDDIPYIIGILVLMYFFYHAYPVDPNMPL